jgi:hypothetical protein
LKGKRLVKSSNPCKPHCCPADKYCSKTVGFVKGSLPGIKQPDKEKCVLKTLASARSRSSYPAQFEGTTDPGEKIVFQTRGKKGKGRVVSACDTKGFPVT